MISTLHWVPKGAPKRVPLRHQLSAAEQAMLERRAAVESELIDDEMDNSDNDMDDLQNGDAADHENDAAFDSLKDVELPAGLNFDDYDAETERLGARKDYVDPEDDPYMQRDNNETDSDDDQASDAEDFTARVSDSFVVVGSTEDDFSCLEVYCYNEDESSLFVHHDITLPAFPLCLAWMDCCSDASASVTTSFDEHMAKQESVHADASSAGTQRPVLTPENAPVGNYMAVGTFKPAIEIWNMDVMDALEPAAVLGGIDDSAAQAQLAASQSNKRKNRKKKNSKGSASAATNRAMNAGFRPGSHTDAVMSLSWNKPYRHLLASGSADKTVKVWDVLNESVVRTFKHHRGKVQSVAWNPVEASVLATGSFDRTMAVFDAKAPEVKNQMIWMELPSDIESMTWSPHNAALLFASCEDGSVRAFDVRKANSPVFTLSAHNGACTSISFAPLVKGLALTSGTDKVVKLWDLEGGQNGQPTCIKSKSMNDIGQVFAAGFNSHSPWVAAAGGSNGKLAIWDLETDTPEILPRFQARGDVPSRVLSVNEVPSLVVRPRQGAQGVQYDTTAVTPSEQPSILQQATTDENTVNTEGTSTNSKSKKKRRNKKKSSS